MWREQAIRRGLDEMNTIAYPAGTPLSVRTDWRDAQGRAASTPERLAAEALAPFGTGTAILNCLYGAPMLFSEDLQAAFCRALNDWIAHEWLDRDTRLRASIVVPLTNAEMAVTEIERRAADPRFVQVLLPVSGEVPLGRRQNWPIYAAAERHHLPIGVHAGSSYRHPVTGVGWPGSFTEDYINQAVGFQSALSSLLAEGVFAKFPDLTVVLMESGVSWLPAFMWRANKTWRGVRVEVPWIDREPAAIIRDHFRVTMQPFDGPPDAAGVADIIEMIGSDKMFLFASDYPHWQFDGDDAIPPHLPASLVSRMCAENPLETFPRLSLAA
jgi:predicted TIM-barrel fold metal-dependent hydrolase